MATTIKLKNSVTTTNTPSSLVQGEVAINVTDKKVWVGNAATTPIQIVGAGTTGNAAGSNNQVQYNSSGSFAGDADFTFNGTTVTMANDASISGLTVGKGANAVSQNTAVGGGALASGSLSGNNNTGAGYAALASTTSGTDNSAFGRIALLTNTTGSSNSAFGSGALYLNTTGGSNNAFGQSALFSNTTASFNAAFGNGALSANTTGANNTGLGYQTLNSNTTASNNTAVGYQAGYAVTTGSVTAFGSGAGVALTTGTDNTFIGKSAGNAITTGTTNTFVGFEAGANTATGVSGSVCLGRDAGYGLAATNTLYIARDNVGAGNAGCWIFGSSAGACNQGNNSSSWTTTSDERVKNILGASTKGLAEIMQLEVKNFKYKTKEEMPEFVFNELGNPVVQPDSEKQFVGVIAQPTQAVFPEAVESDDKGILKVDSDPIFWAMLKAIQELKAEVDSLKAQLNNGA